MAKTPSKSPRKNHMKFLASNEEKQMIAELADTAGLTVSDFLRQTVRGMYEEMKNAMARAS